MVIGSYELEQRVTELEKIVAELKATKSKPASSTKKRKGPLDIPADYFHYLGDDYREGFEYIRGKWAKNRMGDYGKSAELYMDAVRAGKVEQAIERAEEYIESEMKRGGEWYMYVPLLTTWLGEGRYL